MSRSGYSDDCDGADLVMWRGQIASATRGKRGQRFFRELVTALDEMPAKRLVANDFATPEGDVCALGCLARAKGSSMPTVTRDEYGDEDLDYDALGAAFDIAPKLSQEVMFMNDEGAWKDETPEQRWTRVRTWAARQIRVLPDELLPDGSSGIEAAGPVPQPTAAEDAKESDSFTALINAAGPLPTTGMASAEPPPQEPRCKTCDDLGFIPSTERIDQPACPDCTTPTRRETR